jgi:ethanolamine utilization protein EutN
VYYEGGREAALALDPWFVPIDHTIIGIVDANPASGLTRGDRE